MKMCINGLLEFLIFHLFDSSNIRGPWKEIDEEIFCIETWNPIQMQQNRESLLEMSLSSIISSDL